MSFSGKPGRVPDWRSVFAMPLIIGLASAAGLLAALLLGEIGRYLAWLAVGSPIITVTWFGLRQGRKRRLKRRAHLGTSGWSNHSVRKN
jgi:hypothetical protein